VEFTWDERKNRVNQRKHGISFETAIPVFDDPFHVSRQDREDVEEDDNLIRILSARKATPQERRIYAQGY
jgi:uncharacterized protein